MDLSTYHIPSTLNPQLLIPPEANLRSGDQIFQNVQRQATLYIGESAATLARFEAEYDLLMTNRLVLQPLFEINIYGKAIPEREIGAGISSTEAGLRLRYEIRREFAPYVGLVWHRQFGGTADFSEAAGRDIGGWRFAAGLRTWF